MADIMFAGTGGQGVLTAGKIMIEIAAEAGKNVCWTSEYSAEMRGGTALCRVVISDEDIGSPYPDLLDVLCCMNEDAYVKYAPQLRPNGALVYNSSVFTPESVPDGIAAWGVDALGLAAAAGNPRGANLVLMGAMIKATGMIEVPVFEAALTAYFEQKGKGAAENLECFRLGLDRAGRLS